MVTDNRALGVGLGYPKRLKGSWEIALLGLGTSAQLAEFDIAAMAAVGRRLRVSLIFWFGSEGRMPSSRGGLRGSVRGRDALGPKD